MYLSVDGLPAWNLLRFFGYADNRRLLDRKWRFGKYLAEAPRSSVDSCRILATCFVGVLLSHHSSMPVKELIRACAEGTDGAAWEEFVARFQRPISLSIARTASKWGKDPALFVDDLLQEVYCKLWADKCRLLSRFSQEHSDEAVLGYIKTIAINAAHDYFKSLHSQKHGGGETDQIAEDFDPPAHGGSFGHSEAMDRGVFLKQVDARLQGCASGANQERDCLIFWFYYLQGMSAKSIAALATIKLTAKGVEAVIFRLTRCVREHLGSAGTADSAEA
jgi:RNA polymerase sigma-70 factor (ECF subfamily)